MLRSIYHDSRSALTDFRLAQNPGFKVYQDKLISAAQGTGLCASLNGALLSWSAIHDHLEKNHNSVFRSFADIEHVESDHRLAALRVSRQAGGFAFQFWCTGGDLKDIASLTDSFDGMLGMNNVLGSTIDPEQHSEARANVIAQVMHNAQQVSETRESDIWSKSLADRLRIVKQWQEEAGRALLVDQLVEIHRRHQAANQRLHQHRVDIDAHRISQQDVIGVTTTACAKYWQLLKMLDLQTVICEEAGEVIEAHSLCTLFPSIKHAIFVGDPLQLRAQVNEQEMAVENGSHYRLDQSLFERLMIPMLHEVRPFPTSRLSIQRRAHPVIADIMRATLYPDLKDDLATHKHPPVAGLTERLWWFDHRHPEERPDPKSKFPLSFLNSFEIDMIFGLVQYLVHTNEYNFGDIAVLTPYNGQLEALSQRLRGTCSIWLIEKDKETLRDLQDPDDLNAQMNEDANGKITFDMFNMLRLATVDNFQGEEAKIVILSTVRSNFNNQVGFLKTKNRINVACSRARHGFYIIGNASLMQKNENWRPIVNLLTCKGNIGPNLHACCSRHPKYKYEISGPKDFEKVPICDLVCAGILDCGHICKDKCHPRSLHKRMLCTYPCHRRHKGCDHECQKLCWEPCGDCNRLTTPAVLPCGHTFTMTCKEAKDGIVPNCEAMIESTQLDCGHFYETKCDSQGEVPVCQQSCSAILACGHHCSAPCLDCQNRGTHAKCDGQCGGIGDCGHSCSLPCHSGPCPPCKVLVEKACAHTKSEYECSEITYPCLKPCAHLAGCSAICSMPCTRTASNNPCHQILECGHICPSLADERCPENCTQCRTGAFPEYYEVYLPCTHAIDVRTLDQHLKIAELFQITDSGTIEKPHPLAMSRLQQPMACPNCGQLIEEVRRYSNANKLRNLSTILDEYYVVLGRKLNLLMKDTFYTRKDLRDLQDRKSFTQRLAAGPLGGKTNENLVRSRGTRTNELQYKMITYRGRKLPFHSTQYALTRCLDEVINPLEASLSGLERFVGHKALAALLRVKRETPATSKQHSDLEQESLVSLTSLVDPQPPTGENTTPRSLQEHEDGSEGESTGHNLSNNAVIRELMQQAKDREIAQRERSPWNVPRKPRPFISILRPVPFSNAVDGEFNKANLPFKLRLESLYCRCRLMILEDATFMVGELRKLDPSKHTNMLLQGLRHKTIDHAKENIEHLDNAIAAASAKYLKRLNVELRLLQVSFHAVLSTLGTDSGIDIQASVQVMLDLCVQYPDTAGTFLASCTALKRALETGSRDWKLDLYSRHTTEFWKKWAGHEVGYLRHCVNGHPYSGYTFTDCPECGRYVEPKEQEETVDPASFLKEEQFVAHMKNMKQGMKWASHVRLEQAIGGEW